MINYQQNEKTKLESKTQQIERESKTINEKYQQIPSESLLNYNKTMNQFDLNQRQMIKQLADQNILYLKSNNYSNQRFIINQIKTSLDGSCRTLIVILGNFQLKINVYIHLQQSPAHLGYSFARGGFGDIYKINFHQKQFVVKCISCDIFQNTINFKNEKLVIGSQTQIIIKQYCFAKIFSALEIGPKILRPFGFDIVFNSTCGEFFQQKCQKPYRYFNIYSKKQLLHDLKRIHYYQIVHQDIKPENLLYSPFYKKIVFCDFGITKIIFQKLGFKTLTGFVGSINYVGLQLKKLYLTSKKDYVDLYYNDLESLQLTFEKVSKIYFNINSLQNKTEEDYKKNTIQNNKQFYLIFCKFHLFNSTPQSIDIFDFHNQRQIYEKILDFMKVFLPTKQNIQFLEKISIKSKKQNFMVQKVNSLKKVYKNQNLLLKQNQSIRDSSFILFNPKLKKLKFEKTTSFILERIEKNDIAKFIQALSKQSQEISFQEFKIYAIGLINYIYEQIENKINQKLQTSFFFQKIFKKYIYYPFLTQNQKLSPQQEISQFHRILKTIFKLFQSDNTPQSNSVCRKIVQIKLNYLLIGSDQFSKQSKFFLREQNFILRIKSHLQIFLINNFYFRRFYNDSYFENKQFTSLKQNIQSQIKNQEKNTMYQQFSQRIMEFFDYILNLTKNRQINYRQKFFELSKKISFKNDLQNLCRKIFILLKTYIIYCGTFFETYQQIDLLYNELVQNCQGQFRINTFLLSMHKKLYATSLIYIGNLSRTNQKCEIRLFFMQKIMLIIYC